LLTEFEEFLEHPYRTKAMIRYITRRIFVIKFWFKRAPPRALTIEIIISKKLGC
jgi:hypothetical protein